MMEEWGGVNNHCTNIFARLHPGEDGVRWYGDLYQTAFPDAAHNRDCQSFDCFEPLLYSGTFLSEIYLLIRFVKFKYQQVRSKSVVLTSSNGQCARADAQEDFIVRVWCGCSGDGA
jgi:hypothetical protein